MAQFLKITMKFKITSLHTRTEKKNIYIQALGYTYIHTHIEIYIKPSTIYLEVI